MRFSHLFGKTQRETPAETETISHLLMVKAGMIQQLASGVYSLMPFALRAIQKIERIVREEMNGIGAQELLMPAMHPVELWDETGRSALMSEILLRIKDRRGRMLVLGPTHEEVVTDLVRRNVQSYRDLPLLLYQIQTKFRDEPRPRGGLIRVREFTMKDAYSFHGDEADLDRTYRQVYDAYGRIFSRCGLNSLAVEADTGAIGGRESHEFMLIAESGENVVVHCPNCRYAANQERAVFVKEDPGRESPEPIAEIPTPGIKTIDELANFVHLPHRKTLKAVFYTADGEVVFAVIRGDLEVNEVKLANALKAVTLRLATNDEVTRAGLVAGYASPMGLQGVRVVADDSIVLGSNFVAGANKEGYHLKNVNYPRDFAVDLMADIASATAGHVCARCGGELSVSRGIEVGHVFKLGLTYSTKMHAEYLDRDGQSRPIWMGCYGIGTGRLLAAAIEQDHDEKGIIWPASIAPYLVHLVGLNLDNAEVAPAAESAYHGLLGDGLDTLYDDRDESPGVKFNDADLLGCPVRVTVSPRSLKAGGAEIKRRTERAARVVPLADVPTEVRRLLASEV